VDPAQKQRELEEALADREKLNPIIAEQLRQFFGDRRYG
jgi:hypothetical protein